MHPSLLIVTPAELSAAQRKAGLSSRVLLPGTIAAAQTIQTAQVGTFEIVSHNSNWSMNMTKVE
jgi:hypothetical protein